MNSPNPRRSKTTCLNCHSERSEESLQSKSPPVNPSQRILRITELGRGDALASASTWDKIYLLCASEWHMDLIVIPSAAKNLLE